MNLHTVPRRSRKFLTAVAVAAVAATCMVSAGTVSAVAGHDRSGVTQATKEWKRPAAQADLVLATKEWKTPTRLTSGSKTKEW
jgi:hypothetical protein